MEREKTQNSQHSTEEEEQIWRIGEPNFKTHYQATIMRKMWYW